MMISASISYIRYVLFNMKQLLQQYRWIGLFLDDAIGRHRYTNIYLDN